MQEKLEKRVNYLTNLIFFVVLLVFVGIRICAYYNLFSFMGKYASYYLSLITQIGIIFLLPVVLLKVLSKSSTKDVFKFCCYKKISFKLVIASILLGIVVFFVNVYVSNFFNSIIAMLGYKHSSGGGAPTTWVGFVLSMLCTAVLPAICEENLTRGIVLNGNAMTGMKKSILISGLLFGLLHLNIEQFFYATLIGFFLGYLCWGCSSIIPGMIVHFVNNAMSVFLGFAANKGWGIGGIFESIAKFVYENRVLGMILLILCLGFLVYAGFCIVRYMMAETLKKDFVQRQKEFATFAMRRKYFQGVENIKKGLPQPDEEIEIKTDEKEFGKFVDDNIAEIVETAAKMQPELPKVKMSSASKVFLIGSIVLSSIMTILTFVWGVL